MPTNYTPNYQLNQWERTDKVLMEDFNSDNAKIDTALTAEARARAAAVDTLTQTVSSKADTTALLSLSQTVSDHTATLTRKGDCRIYTTSYTGNGNYGIASPCSLTFPGKPLVIFFSPRNGGPMLIAIQGQPSNFTLGASTVSVGFTWSGNSLSWSCYADAQCQMNGAGVVYDVIVLLKA